MDLEQRMINLEKEVADLKWQLEGQPIKSEFPRLDYMLALIDKGTEETIKEIKNLSWEPRRNCQLAMCDSRKSILDKE